VEDSSAENGDDIAQIQGDSGEGENGVGSDGAGEVKKTRQDTDKGGKPNCAQGSESLLRVLAKVTAVGKTWKGKG